MMKWYASFERGSLALFCGALLGGCGQPPELRRLEATSEVVQQEIFDVACVQCHHDGFAAGGLDLSSLDVSMKGLIDVLVVNEVARENGWRRIVPGEPERSFLIRKVESPGVGEGQPMPPGQQALHPQFIELMRTWIASLPNDEGA